MRIRTSRTKSDWAEIRTAAGADDFSNLGTAEISRHLSQAVRSANLIVLAGLGTSLCVKEGTITLAPTMHQLTRMVMDRFEELDGEEKMERGQTRWETFKRLARVQETAPNLESLLSKAKVAADFLGGPEGILEAALLAEAEEVIREAVDFVSPSTDLKIHENFLRRIARRPARRSRVKVYTTNYDLCFEAAAGRSGFIVVDGFAFGADSVFNPDQFNYDVVRRDAEERADYVENLFHLLKMHGSVDWEQNETTGQVSKRPGTKRPILIYPRSTKYEMAFSPPYVDMMSSFQSSMRAPGTTLLVIGFGFNDKHIAEPILAAVRSNLSFNIVVVDPSLGNKCDAAELGANDYLTALKHFVDSGDGRIALVEGTFEDVIPFVPDTVAETDLERHQDRVRRLTHNV